MGHNYALFKPFPPLQHDIDVHARRSHSIQDVVALFMPSSNLQLEAYPSIVAGLTILSFCIFTTALPSGQRLWRLIRMSLSIPAMLCFVEHGWGWSDGWAYKHDHNRSTYLGLGTVACYGIMRVLEICWVGELDGNRPRHAIKPKAKDEGEPQAAREAVAKPIPIPVSLTGRLGYTVDLLTTVRGGSWYSGRIWEFAPQYFLTYIPPTGDSKLGFVLWKMRQLLQYYLIMDIIDTFARSIRWDTTTQRPVTALPLWLQVPVTITVCATTIIYMSMPYTVMSIAGVALGMSPRSWPPLVHEPFSSTSLRDFWSNRYHHIFRRVFDRLSAAILWVVPSSWRYKRIARQLVIFFLTTMLHLLLLSTLPPWNTPENPRAEPYPFVSVDTVTFFLSQPLGLAVESLAILPLTNTLADPWKNRVRAGFAWFWLLWTGRYWSDVWIGKGLYGDTERPIVWSPVRGLLYGVWIV